MPATANTSIASSASEHLTITAGQVQANGITIAYESFGATDRETVLLVVLIVIINGIAWLDGSTQFGKFDLYRTSIPFYPVSILVLMHYLDNVARHARAVFRPALGASEAEYARFEYELTTMPGRETRAALGLLLLFTAAYIWFTPFLAGAFRRSPWLFGIDSVFYVVTFGMIAVFVYYTLYQ